MSTLIIGGLLVIGVIALVGVFFVARTAGTNSERNAAPAAPINSVPSAPSAPAPVQETYTTPEQHDMSASSAQKSQPTFSDEEEPILYRIRGEQKEEPLTITLNGQFHELANGLRVLRQQSAEMEHRLSSLTLMLDTIEQKQHEKE